MKQFTISLILLISVSLSSAKAQHPTITTIKQISSYTFQTLMQNNYGFDTTSAYSAFITHYLKSNGNPIIKADSIEIKKINAKLRNSHLYLRIQPLNTTNSPENKANTVYTTKINTQNPADINNLSAFIYLTPAYLQYCKKNLHPALYAKVNEQILSTGGVSLLVIINHINNNKYLLHQNSTAQFLSIVLWPLINQKANVNMHSFIN